MVAVVEGLSYDDLRTTPIPELLLIQAEVNRIIAERNRNRG